MNISQKYVNLPRRFLRQNNLHISNSKIVSGFVDLYFPLKGILCDIMSTQKLRPQSIKPDTVVETNMYVIHVLSFIKNWTVIFLSKLANRAYQIFRLEL